MRDFVSEALLCNFARDFVSATSPLVSVTLLVDIFVRDFVSAAPLDNFVRDIFASVALCFLPCDFSWYFPLFFT